jgi:surfactin synthase thioesterase subunit
MSRTQPGWIRRFHRPSAPESGELLIFPHAGSGASSYRTLSKLLADSFTVGVVQYPGRQDRVREPSVETLPELAAGAFAEYAGAGPLTVFGHSMGAIVAFEFVRLAEAAGVPVRLLCVSAAAAPALIADLPPHPTDDDALLAHAAALRGTGTAVLEDRQLMALALPVMKADYRAFDRYHCPAEVRVAAPIQVLGGADDAYVAPRDLHAWHGHSHAEVRVTLFDGGHFYLDAHHDEIAALLAAVPAAR